MSITVVGSIAFDAVKTPLGERERMLGGAATHFALAASFFDTVSAVGPVGEDFGPGDFDVLGTRGTLTDDVEQVEGGETFFWRGEYGWDFNSRETLETRLNVFESFEPKLSDASRACDVLFLANIQPSLQRQVLDQCGAAKFVAVDSMNLWIDTAREDLVDVIKRVDAVILNDAELRQLTQMPNTVAAAREVLGWGPRAVVAKQGEYGAALVTADSYFSVPAFPLQTVADPTGAGDSFAGGFVGFVARNLGDSMDEAALRRAMAYGTAIASFNVEEFGTERVQRLEFEEVEERIAELHRSTQFDHEPLNVDMTPTGGQR